MPRKLPPMKPHIFIDEEQRLLQMSHMTPAMVPKLPESLEARTKLRRHLEYMGLGPFFINFPWMITSTVLVDELTQHQTISDELQHLVYWGAVHLITKEVISQVYGSRSTGDKRPPKNKNKHKDYFTGEKESAGGYPLDTCRIDDMRDIFRFLCPILHPLCLTWVHIYRFNQMYLLLYKGALVNWTKILYRALYKCSLQIGCAPASYMSLFLFHYYNRYNALTQSERQLYRQALSNIQEKLAQGQTLNPNTPELDHVTQSEIPLEPVNRGFTIGTQRQAQTSNAGEGSSRGGSRLSTPEHCSPSPMVRVQPDHSPPARRGLSRTRDSDDKDGYTEEEYTPSVRSSARGKRRRQQSLTRERPSKVHGIKPGLSTPVRMYQVQAPGGSATPIRSPASCLVHPSPIGPTPSSVGPAPNPMGPSLSVLQQPIPAPVLGTATHPVVLDQSTLDQSTLMLTRNHFPCT
jgi:hypothetical protein